MPLVGKNGRFDCVSCLHSLPVKSQKVQSFSGKSQKVSRIEGHSNSFS